jgi:hypothetical protein
MQKGSYLAAWDLASGKQIRKTTRTDEISTWGTPAIVRTTAGRDDADALFIVANVRRSWLAP